MKLLFVSTPKLRFLLGLILAFAGAFGKAEGQVVPQLNPDQLDQLMGPIALYPDALVALILPASTVPTDIVLAQRYLSGGGDPDQIDNQPWTDSVKGLARYPMLIQWLDENLTWTQQLGGAFLNQPDAIMESVQRLRAKARANGTLTSTPQQKLVLDGDVIEIVPAQPDVIYVPYYDPAVVYGQPVYYGGPPYMTFGLGFGVGYWLAYDMNWHNRVIVVGDRHHNWYEHHDWKHKGGSSGRPNYGSNWHAWTPPARPPSHSRPDSYRPPQNVAQPRPFPRNYSGPSHSDHQRPDSNSHQRPDNNSRNSDHNRPSAPSPSPATTAPSAPAPAAQAPRTQDNHDHRPSPNSGSRRGPYPQPGPAVTNPQAGPVPAPNPAPGDMPRPTAPANQIPPGARPEGGPQPRGGSHQPGPTPNRQPPSRPPAPVPATVAPSYPTAPEPAPPPSPPPRDRSRDDKPEVQR